jgi:hypothetical protein
MADYVLSSTWVRGFVKVLRHEGRYDELLARAAPAVQVAMAEPGRELWWPREVGQGFVALIGTFPNAFAEKVGALVVRQSVAPIIMPLVKVVLAVSGKDPRTLLSRMPQLVNSSLRGVEVSFVSEGPGSGRLSLRYPFRVEEPTAYLWRGTVSYVLDMTDRALTAPPELTWSDDHQGFTLAYAWA